MSDIVIHGFPASTYTRTARLAAEEKGLAYSLVETRTHIRRCIRSARCRP